MWVTAPTLLFVFPVPLWSRGRHDPLLPVGWSGYQEQERQAQGTGYGTQHLWMLTLRSNTGFGSRIVSSPPPARSSMSMRFRPGGRFFSVAVWLWFHLFPDLMGKQAAWVSGSGNMSAESPCLASPVLAESKSTEFAFKGASLDTLRPGERQLPPPEDSICK